jgi:hypothetical protein
LPNWRPTSFEDCRGTHFEIAGVRIITHERCPLGAEGVNLEAKSRLIKFPKNVVAQKFDLATFAHSFAGGLAGGHQITANARAKNQF